MRLRAYCLGTGLVLEGGAVKLRGYGLGIRTSEVQNASGILVVEPDEPEERRAEEPDHDAAEKPGDVGKMIIARLFLDASVFERAMAEMGDLFSIFERTDGGDQ